MPVTDAVGRTLASRASRVLGGALVAAGSAAAMSTWVGTRILTRPATRALRPTLRARFLPADGDQPPVVLLSGLEADVPGCWGLRVDGAFLQIDGPLRTETDRDGPWTARPYRLLEGELPATELLVERRRRRVPLPPTTRAGDGGTREGAGTGRADRRSVQLADPWPVAATITSYAWPDDPQVLARDHGATLQLEAVRTPRGWLPAWRFTPGDDTETAGRQGDDDRSGTWMIAIHGRATRRSECFRLVHTALSAGVTALVISYRTDHWVRDPVRTSALGATEWEDVEAAVRMALHAGADRIVLAGCSMGGALAAMFLRRSELGDAVAGVVLDSPALAWNPILEHVATVRRIPRQLIPLVMTAARWRAKLDWDALDHLGGAADFTHPILLLHGDLDPVVPVTTSDTFAAARPDLVTYVRLDGAGHVTGWNTRTRRYERAVTRFLTDVTASDAAHARSALRRPGRFRRVQVRAGAARRAVLPGPLGAASERPRDP